MSFVAHYFSNLNTSAKLLYPVSALRYLAFPFAPMKFQTKQKPFVSVRMADTLDACIAMMSAKLFGRSDILKADTE